MKTWMSQDYIWAALFARTGVFCGGHNLSVNCYYYLFIKRSGFRVQFSSLPIWPQSPCNTDSPITFVHISLLIRIQAISKDMKSWRYLKIDWGWQQFSITSSRVWEVSAQDHVVWPMEVFDVLLVFEAHNSWHIDTQTSSTGIITPWYYLLYRVRTKEAKSSEIKQYLVSADSEFNTLWLITLVTTHPDPNTLQSHQS